MTVAASLGRAGDAPERRNASAWSASQRGASTRFSTANTIGAPELIEGLEWWLEIDPPLQALDQRVKMLRTSQTMPASRPAPGNVRTQAVRMLPATPHRTAESFFVAPTPMIAEVIVCVVEIGAP